jgi:hypothetical protein
MLGAGAIKREMRVLLAFFAAVLFWIVNFEQ